MLTRILLLLLLGAAASFAAPAEKPLFRDFMGVNGHTVLFRPKLYRPVAGLVRDYHPVEWDLGKESDSIPPFPKARNGVDWQHVYGSWKKEGWRIDASLMFETLPREQWKDLAKDSFAYAERFARAFGPSSANPLVECVEIGNEPGKFSDADYRVIFENMARGFRKGDPRLLIATCNLTAGKSHDYAKSVQCVAGLESVYDVLNVHSYAELKGWPTWERSFPEDTALKDFLGDIRRLAEWRDKNAAGKPIWLTEFGYDATTQSPDPKTEFKEWRGVTERQQAEWTIRSWLLLATLPIERAYYYFYNDDDTPQVHGSSGLTRKFEPKPVFHAASHLHHTLADYRFSRVVMERPGEALVYEFVHESGPARKIWAAWSPTGSGRSATLALPAFEGTIEKAERMPLSEKEDTAVSIDESRQAPITEAPLFIFIRSP